MAIFTTGTGETFCQDTASKIAIKLFVDILRHRVFRIFMPGLVVFFDDLEKYCFLRPTWPVYRLGLFAAASIRHLQIHFFRMKYEE